MWPKRLGGIAVGIVTALIAIMATEWVTHMIWPPPPGTNFNDPAQMDKMIASIPFEAKIGVIVAWFLGTWAGAWAAFRLSGWATAAWIIVAVVLLGTAMTLIAIPHPTWMMVAGLIAPMVAGGLALRLGRRSAPF